ncbi:MAG: ISL3 family transposase [bacterium]|nr:ISL3 family transposase [bacterium]
MRATTVLRSLLSIENTIVTGSHKTLAGNLVIQVKPSWLTPRCWECGRKCRSGRVALKGTEGRCWRHLDMAGVMVFVEYDRRRPWCKKCRGWRTEKVPWADQATVRCTRDFDNMIAYWAQRTDKTSITAAFRIAWYTVGNCIERVVARLRPEDPLADLRVIGADEISYRKHHRYLTTVVDLQRGKVVWAKEGKNAKTLEEFFDELGEERSAAIQVASIDMSKAYISAIREKIPHALLIFDRFHVQQLVSKALDETRRAEWQRLRKAGDPDAAKAIKNTRWALRRLTENQTDDDRLKLSLIQRENKRLYRGYLLNAQFVEAMNEPDPDKATKLLRAWLAWAFRCQLPAFVKAAKTIRDHLDGVVAYLTHRWTNAVTEGLNNKTRVITRRAYGFHSAEALIAMIMLCCTDVEVPVPIKRAG